MLERSLGYKVEERASAEEWRVLFVRLWDGNGRQSGGFVLRFLDAICGACGLNIPDYLESRTCQREGALREIEHRSTAGSGLWADRCSIMISHYQGG